MNRQKEIENYFKMRQAHEDWLNELKANVPPEKYGCTIPQWFGCLLYTLVFEIYQAAPLPSEVEKLIQQTLVAAKESYLKYQQLEES